MKQPNLFNARERFRREREVYERAIASLKDSTVCWDHGEQERRGFVVDTSGERIEVYGDTGKSYWIYADRITAIYKRGERICVKD